MPLWRQGETMTAPTQANRVFVFLQGPHGPFFHALGRMLRTAGAQVWRVGFNAGDRAFWFHSQSLLPYYGTPAEWPDEIGRILDTRKATDIVLYGDTRPIHAAAIKAAQARGLKIGRAHV